MIHTHFPAIVLRANSADTARVANQVFDSLATDDTLHRTGPKTLPDVNQTIANISCHSTRHTSYLPLLARHHSPRIDPIAVVWSVFDWCRLMTRRFRTPTDRAAAVAGADPTQQLQSEEAPSAVPEWVQDSNQSSVVALISVFANRSAQDSAQDVRYGGWCCDGSVLTVSAEGHPLPGRAYRPDIHLVWMFRRYQSSLIQSYIAVSPVRHRHTPQFLNPPPFLGRQRRFWLQFYYH